MWLQTQRGQLLLFIRRLLLFPTAMHRRKKKCLKQDQQSFSLSKTKFILFSTPYQLQFHTNQMPDLQIFHSKLHTTSISAWLERKKKETIFMVEGVSVLAPLRRPKLTAPSLSFLMILSTPLQKRKQKKYLSQHQVTSRPHTNLPTGCACRPPHLSTHRFLSNISLKA